MEGVIHLDLQPQWITPFYSVDLQNSSHPTQSHSIIAKYTTAFLHSNWLYFLWHDIKYWINYWLLMLRYSIFLLLIHSIPATNHPNLTNPFTFNHLFTFYISRNSFTFFYLSLGAYSELIIQSYVRAGTRFMWFWPRIFELAASRIIWSRGIVLCPV